MQLGTSNGRLYLTEPKVVAQYVCELRGIIALDYGLAMVTNQL